MVCMNDEIGNGIYRLWQLLDVPPPVGPAPPGAHSSTCGLTFSNSEDSRLYERSGDVNTDVLET